MRVATRIALFLDSTRWGRFASTMAVALAGWFAGLCGNVIANGVQHNGLTFVLHTTYALYALIALTLPSLLSQWLLTESRLIYSTPYLRVMHEVANACEEDAKAHRYANVKKGADVMDDLRRRAKEAEKR